MKALSALEDILQSANQKQLVKTELSSIWIYSMLLLQLPALLFIDLCRYKPVIVFQGLCQVIVYGLLCFASSFQAMKWLQVISAMVTTCEIAIYSYVCSVVTVDQYGKAFICSRWFNLLGYTIGALGGQLMVSYGHFSYYWLNIITLGSASVAFIISIFLPMLSTNYPCSECLNDQIKRKDRNIVHCCCKVVVKFLKQQWLDICESYSYNTMIWSLLWLLVTAGCHQVTDSSERLWEKLLEHSDSVYLLNGGVEAVAAVLGLIAFFVMDRIKVDWSYWGELVVSALCAVDCAATLAMAITSSIWVGYAGYIVCKTTYMISNTIVILNITLSVTRRRYALVFVMNKFISLLPQELVSLVMTYLNLEIYIQFIIYSYYLDVLTLSFGIIAVFRMVSKTKKSRRNQQTTNDSAGCP
ncbi:thiamine transporter 1-like [Pseudophryne corroboree]|uniref:thiamine transporter 1-like n=1 Tax=Pseudophryne corroboree TaxID=495146 RepID=UPI0030814114